MRPPLITSYYANQGWTYTKLFCQMSLYTAKLSYVLNLVNTKFCHRVALSTLLSALVNLVGGVFGISSKEKMIGVTTSWVVALVTNTHVGRYFPMNYRPRKTVGLPPLSFFVHPFRGVFFNVPISISVNQPNPLV